MPAPSIYSWMERSNIGSHVFIKRAELKLSARELDKVIGLPIGTTSKIERRVGITPDKMDKVFQFLAMKPEEAIKRPKSS